mmetsp:Transcript_88927/g.256397  ORF Transcript_88927/g.256397 Transcript_88927/m.256397 type:complete len:415 (+) Transcript_88927:788-2032(+)
MLHGLDVLLEPLHEGPLGDLDKDLLGGALARFPLLPGLLGHDKAVVETDPLSGLDQRLDQTNCFPDALVLAHELKRLSGEDGDRTAREPEVANVLLDQPHILVSHQRDLLRLGLHLGGGLLPGLLLRPETDAAKVAVRIPLHSCLPLLAHIRILALRDGRQVSDCRLRHLVGRNEAILPDALAARVQHLVEHALREGDVGAGAARPHDEGAPSGDLGDAVRVVGNPRRIPGARAQHLPREVQQGLRQGDLLEVPERLGALAPPPVVPDILPDAHPRLRRLQPEARGLLRGRDGGRGDRQLQLRVQLGVCHRLHGRLRVAGVDVVHRPLLCGDGGQQPPTAADYSGPGGRAERCEVLLRLLRLLGHSGVLLGIVALPLRAPSLRRRAHVLGDGHEAAKACAGGRRPRQGQHGVYC